MRNTTIFMLEWLQNISNLQILTFILLHLKQFDTLDNAKIRCYYSLMNSEGAARRPYPFGETTMTYIRTNDQAAHEFFYSEASEVTFARSLTLTFDNRQAKSYATTIALRTRDKAGAPVTLLSIDGMSRATRRHRSLIYGASPCRVLEVPFEWSDDFRFCEDAEVFAVLSRRFLERLESAADRTMTRAENRRAFLDLWGAASAFSEAVCTIDGLSDFADMAEQVREVESAKAEKRRALIERHGLMGAIKRAFVDHDEKARRLLDPVRELAFAWRDESGDYVTSKGIHMPKAVGDTALRLWAAGKLRHGMEVDRYTVLSVTSAFVTVGCHKLPVDNLRALYESL